MSRPDESSALRDELLRLAQGYLDGDGATPFFGRLARLPGVRNVFQTDGADERIAITKTFMKTLREMRDPEHNLSQVQAAVAVIIQAITDGKVIASPRLNDVIKAYNAVIAKVQKEVHRDASKALEVRRLDAAQPPIMQVPPLPPTPHVAPRVVASEVAALSFPSAKGRVDVESKVDDVREEAAAVKPVIVTRPMFSDSGVAQYAALDYYQQLGVGQEASADDIRKAYYQLARQLNPDKNPPAYNDHATKLFTTLCCAYENLSDAGKRLAYDAQLTERDFVPYQRPEVKKYVPDPSVFDRFGPEIKKAVNAITPKTTTSRLLTAFGITAAVAAAVIVGRSGSSVPPRMGPS
ncbi:MAG: J domain-containing protein [Coxiellaceae bacterium]|nr:J domain-containing protein [Coxiellaceae bacterium]